MAHFFTPAHIEHLRRQAKKLKKANGISHNEALNQVVQANGYSDWALMMKQRVCSSYSVFYRCSDDNLFDA